jgi:iron complex outermembrane receptor protein
MNKPYLITQVWRGVMSAVMALPLVVSSALAQTGTTAPSDTVKLDKYVVTGSFIPRAASEPATAVTVVTTEDIAKTGVSGDLLEVLRKAVPQIIGNGNLGSSNSNIAGGTTNGGSQILLRNTSTLVLIDGRRAAFAPVSATGGFTFVDINAIPVSAVESIEVITDGASALYGSDAVSGVVNIKLKKYFDGVEIGGGYRYGTQKGHWEERKANFAFGTHNEKTSVVVSAEWVDSDPIYQYERTASSPSFGTPTFAGVVQIGGTVSGAYYLLNPSLNAPPLNQNLTAAQLVANGTYKVNPATNQPYTFSEIQNVFDLSRAVTLIVSNQKKTATMNLEHKFNDNVSFFGDVLYAQTNSFYQINAQPLTDVGLQTHAANDPRNPFDITVRARNRFTDYPRQYFSDTNSIRAMGGFRGKLNDTISWEMAFTHNQVDQLYRNKNVIDTAKLQAAVTAGTINMFALRQAPGAIESAGIFGTAYAANTSLLNSFDARIYGDLPFEMPGGTPQFAFGGEIRHEGLKSEPDAGSLPNGTTGEPLVWTTATTFNNFNAVRNVKSVFAEVRLPLTSPKQNIGAFHTLELDVAVRRDAYSDNESPVVPKVQLRWLPVNDEFAIRLGYSKSFIAPTLFQINGPDAFGVTGSINGINPFGGGAPQDLGQLNFVQRANGSGLKPQKSTTNNFGIVYSPRAIKGFSFEASYFDLTLKDIIGAYPATTMVQDVETNGPASPYAQYITFGNFRGFPGAVPVTARGQMVHPPGGLDAYVIGLTVNVSEQKQSGIDYSMKYDFEMKDVGKFYFQMGGTWYKSYATTLLTNVTESVGKNELINGTIPHWLTNANLDFTRGDMNFGLGLQYIGAVDEVVEPDVVGHQAAFTSIDVRAGYKFTSGFLKGLTVRAGVNNVFDKGPPLSPTVNSGINYDQTVYTAATYGRVVYVSGSYKF